MKPFKLSTFNFKLSTASPLGSITLASDGTALTGLWFEGQKHFGSTLTPDAAVKDDLPVFSQTRRWLDLYFSGKDPGFIPPLHLHGTDFQKHVWNLLLTIPYGQTITYGDLARRLASELGCTSMSAQAVGNAVGHNPISIIIPCHRVIAADGSLTGYAAGLHRKHSLLLLERTAASPRNF